MRRVLTILLLTTAMVLGAATVGSAHAPSPHACSSHAIQSNSQSSQYGHKAAAFIVGGTSQCNVWIYTYRKICHGRACSWSSTGAYLLTNV